MQAYVGAHLALALYSFEQLVISTHNPRLYGSLIADRASIPSASFEVYPAQRMQDRVASVIHDCCDCALCSRAHYDDTGSVEEQRDKLSGSMDTYHVI